MIIEKLQIESFRNISKADLSFHQQTNIIQGSNGAGKTALLEAIYLLSRAKSFRTTRPRSLIQRGQSQLTLFTKLKNSQGLYTRIGYQQGSGKADIRINGEPAARLSQLVRSLPIILTTPQSHRLLEEGPEHRRRILNWGVFHVEQLFARQMSNFVRSLRQRNSALRKPGVDLNIWNQGFINTAELVSQAQHAFFNNLKSSFETITQGVSFLQAVEISLQQGWEQDVSLKDALLKRIDADRERGYTTVGPQRADINFSIDGLPTKQFLSRGQQKILLTALFLAQADVVHRLSGERPVFLFDDLESELDEASLSKATELLLHQNVQIFITSIDPKRLNSFCRTQGVKVFHVEHGSFDCLSEC